MAKPSVLVDVVPLTQGQTQIFTAWKQSEHLAIYGSAGTGKSYLSMYLALRELQWKRRDRVIVVRSVVQTRDMGFLPGNAFEKAEIFEQPYVDIVTELTGQVGRYDMMLKEGQIEFTTTSFLRSLTWNRAIVVVDEAQNMTFHEINSIMTRLGNDTRVIVCGDLAQSDLGKNEQTGFGRFLRISKRMPQFQHIQLGHDDIVRSEFVKAWIIACEENKA